MSDLISRQAAIEALRRAEALTRAFGYHNVIETIRELPSVQPQRWIPVTERLPKESDGKVLITVSGKVETGQYSEFSTTWFIGDINGVGGDDPIAWMPLPEPWRGTE